MSVVEPKPDKIRAWASDWADVYEQNHDVDNLREYVGQTVLLEAPPRDEDDEAHKATVHVIGFSVDTIVVPDDEDSGGSLPDVHRYSFLTSEGVQVPLFAKGTVTKVEGPEE